MRDMNDGHELLKDHQMLAKATCAN